MIAFKDLPMRPLFPPTTFFTILKALYSSLYPNQRGSILDTPPTKCLNCLIFMSLLNSNLTTAKTNELLFSIRF